MDLRSRTKIRWIKFYSADLPRKSLSIKDLLIINGGLSIENPACPSSRKSDGLFFLYVQKSVGNLVLQNPSENPSCPSSRKSGGFFGSLLFRNPSKNLFFKLHCFFPTSVEHGAPHESSALTFFHEQRAAPIECSTLATRCLLTLILGVQELSLVAWHYRLYQRSWIDLSKFAQTHTIDGTLDFLVYKALASAQAFLAIELLVDGITVRQELGEFSHSH